MSIDFTSQRQSYEQGKLDEINLPKTPHALAKKWLTTAVAQYPFEAYAMSLATCGKDGAPSVRTVLLRELVADETATDQNGDANSAVHNELSLVFYTNYDSQKGIDLAQNPRAECLFFWANLERQLRFFGQIEPLDAVQSAAYFATRPRDSQLAAWVSAPQSGIVASRDVMAQQFAGYEQQFAHGDVPKPDFWGGYRLIVQKVEFWQGRSGRMHDRILYEKMATPSQASQLCTPAGWTRVRLLP